MELQNTPIPTLVPEDEDVASLSEAVAAASDEEDDAAPVEEEELDEAPEQLADVDSNDCVLPVKTPRSSL